MSLDAQADQLFTVNPTTIQSYGLSTDEWQQVKDIEEKQIKFHAWLKCKQLTRDEGKAMACKTYADFAGFWAEFCERGREIFEVRHESGWKRYTKKYQSFASGVQTFMDDFEPLLDACKEIGKPYSGIAIGTITVLFAVAANKTQMEEQVASALGGVKDRLPSLKMFQEIYNDDTKLEKNLRKTILLAYMEFIDLAMEITRYYFHRGYRRWAVATFKSTKFKDMTDKVHERVHMIRLQCEELLSSNICQIKEMNKGLQREVNSEQVNQPLVTLGSNRVVLAVLRLGQENNHLIELQELFGIPTWSPARQLEELELYRQSILGEQHFEVGFEQMECKNIERFRQGDIFNKWSQNGKSSILILRGVSNTNIAAIKRHCWLSPFALDMIERFGKGKATHAFYLFQAPDRTSIDTALSIIIFQLLSSKSSKLEDHRLALAADAQAFIRLTKGDKYNEKKVDALIQLLTRTMKVFDREDIVYVVIDRLDMCDWSERNDLLRMMVKMTNKASCCVKILLVTKWMDDWRPNENELRANLCDPATLQQVTKVQGITYGY